MFVVVSVIGVVVVDSVVVVCVVAEIVPVGLVVPVFAPIVTSVVEPEFVVAVAAVVDTTKKPLIKKN